jgi:hypothetical protein
LKFEAQLEKNKTSHRKQTPWQNKTRASHDLSAASMLKQQQMPSLSGKEANSVGALGIFFGDTAFAKYT